MLFRYGGQPVELGGGRAETVVQRSNNALADGTEGAFETGMGMKPNFPCMLIFAGISPLHDKNRTVMRSPLRPFEVCIASATNDVRCLFIHQTSSIGSGAIER